MRNHRGKHPEIRDYGPEPFVFNINHATNMNGNFRTTLWTGRDMQLTLISIPVARFIKQRQMPSMKIIDVYDLT